MMRADWKLHSEDLRNRAQFVMADSSTTDKMSARTAARCLAGIVSLVARRWTIGEMQATCAELARNDGIVGIGMLPNSNGRVTEQTQLVAVVARSLVPLAGADNVRAALSFWATEDDPAVWTTVATG